MRFVNNTNEEVNKALWLKNSVYGINLTANEVEIYGVPYSVLLQQLENKKLNPMIF